MNAQNTAQGLSGYGRYGDSTLVHMQPQEVAGLQALANSQGTSLTINPQTGLPEAFNLGGFFRSLAPTLAGIGVGMIPGMQGIGYGIAAGALTGAALNKNDPLMGAVMGGMGGYGGSNLAASAGSFGKQAAVGTAGTPGIPEVAQGAGVTDAFTNPGLMTTSPSTGAYGADGMVTGGGGLNVVPQTADMTALITPPETFGSNLSQAYDNVAANPMGFVKDNPFALGAPLAMAGLESMQPDLTMGQELNDQYDPYARLNLGGRSSRGESGLRLLAAGGPVSFAAGGASMQGGGAGAMQGADATSFSDQGGSSELGLFADQARINEVRAELEAAQLQQQANNFGIGAMGGMGGNSGMYGMSGMGSDGRSGRGAGGIMQFINDNNLSNEDNRDSLNLGRQESIRLANGGTIQAGGLQDLYNTRDDNMTGPALSRDGYGVGRLNSMAEGGMAGYKKGGYLDGPGDGMSDSIPATIEGKQPARLADGEFVIPADVVSHLGNGSTKAGSKRLYAMLDKIRHARTGNKKQGKQINPNKFMPA